MATVKRIADLTPYTSVLPFASEMFGVYQPLLGWKSKRIAQRIAIGHTNDRPYLLDRLTRQFAGMVDIAYVGAQQVQIRLKPGILAGGKTRFFNSVLLEKVAAILPTFDKLTHAV